MLKIVRVCVCLCGADCPGRGAFLFSKILYIHPPPPKIYNFRKTALYEMLRIPLSSPYTPFKSILSMSSDKILIPVLLSALNRKLINIAKCA